MRSSVVHWVLCIGPAVSHGQTAPPPALKTAESPGTAALPTEAEVNEFLRRMFGYDPNVTWTIQGIVPAEAPGVAHVVATIGSQPRPIHLYVLPGAKFAIVGDPIPFGADPFAPVRTALATKAKGVQRGPADAAVTIVEFSDLQCPFCRRAQPVIERLVGDFPEARLIFQPFPLPMHDWALKAASFGECVARQKPDAFWEFINQVYDEQANITEANADEKLAAIATNAGIDGAKAASCSTQPDVYLRIQQSIELGKQVGVNATPTVYINGRKVNSIVDLPYDQLKAIVTFEAGEARKK